MTCWTWTINGKLPYNGAAYRRTKRELIKHACFWFCRPSWADLKKMGLKAVKVEIREK